MIDPTTELLTGLLPDLTMLIVPTIITLVFFSLAMIYILVRKRKVENAIMETRNILREMNERQKQQHNIQISEQPPLAPPSSEHTAPYQDTADN